MTVHRLQPGSSTPPPDPRTGPAPAGHMANDLELVRSTTSIPGLSIASRMWRHLTGFFSWHGYQTGLFLRRLVNRPCPAPEVLHQLGALRFCGASMRDLEILAHALEAPTGLVERKELDCIARFTTRQELAAQGKLTVQELLAPLAQSKPHAPHYYEKLWQLRERQGWTIRFSGPGRPLVNSAAKTIALNLSRGDPALELAGALDYLRFMLDFQQFEGAFAALVPDWHDLGHNLKAAIASVWADCESHAEDIPHARQLWRAGCWPGPLWADAFAKKSRNTWPHIVASLCAKTSGLHRPHHYHGLAELEKTIINNPLRDVRSRAIAQAKLDATAVPPADA